MTSSLNIQPLFRGLILIIYASTHFFKPRGRRRSFDPRHLKSRQQTSGRRPSAGPRLPIYAGGRCKTNQTNVKLFRAFDLSPLAASVKSKLEGVRPRRWDIQQHVQLPRQAAVDPHRGSKLKPKLKPYMAKGAGLLIPANQDLPASALAVRWEKCFLPGLECRCGLAECRKEGPFHPLKSCGENSGIISGESAASAISSKGKKGKKGKEKRKNLSVNSEPVASTLCTVFCKYSAPAVC